MTDFPPSTSTRSAASWLRKIESLPPAERPAAFREAARIDPELFARIVLAEHCRLPFAAHHRLLFAWHRAMGGPLPGRRGRRFALAAPRGAAKSTVASLALPLHDLVFERERYIVLLSATERQARQRLRALRREAEQGPARGWLPDWKATSAALHAGPALMEGFGAGAEIRGASHEGFRPTKIILDDAEPNNVARSPKAREKLHDWFSEVVEHLGDGYTHFLAVGTILHEKGLLATLLGRADFESLRARSIIAFPPEQALWTTWRRLLLDFEQPDRRQRARDFFLAHRAPMEAGAQVLWPEKEDYEELAAQLTLQGRRAFYQEKQNTPLGPEDALFDAEAALRADQREGAWCVHQAANPEPIRRYAAGAGERFGFLDAALGKGRTRNHGDFAALAIVLLMPDQSLILERLVARRLSPTDQIALLYAEEARRPFALLGIEGTGFQELLLELLQAEAKRRGVRLRTEAVHPAKSKTARISALEPLLSTGALAIGADADEEFWEELNNWPRSTHDDALDAVAGAVALAQARRQKTSWDRGGERRGGKLRF